MVAAYDHLTRELKRSCVLLSDELIFSPQRYQGEVYFHIEIPSVSKFFRIGYPEYVFISLLDGKTSFSHALAVASQQLGDDALTESQATQTLLWLLENGLGSLADNQVFVDARQREEDNKPSILKRLNPFWMKIPLGKPDDLIGQLEPAFRWMFAPLAIIVSVFVMLAALVILSTNWNGFVASSTMVFARSNWFWMLGTWVVLKLIHEFAHAMVCHRLGGNVKETGIIFILIAPMAYVDVTSSLRFSSRWKRMAVAGAGIYVELLIAAICVIAWSVTTSPWVAYHLFNVVLLASISTLLFNGNPLMRFDGYFILSDLMKIPNLYASGTKSFNNLMRWLFLGVAADQSCCELKNHPRFIMAYGICAQIWKIIVYVGLSIAASVMFGGLGILISAIGIVLWIVLPMKKLIQSLIEVKKSRPHAILRGSMVSFVIAGVLTGSWFLIPSPFESSHPCLVDFGEMSKVRAESVGFVEAVFVRDSQMVKKGDRLLRIANRTLVAEVEELAAELARLAALERIAIDQRNPAEAQVQRQNQSATQIKLAESQLRLDQCLIVAPADGQVVARNIHQILGTYVEPGDVLMIIGDEASKEIVVSLDATDAHWGQSLIGSTIPIEIGSRRRINAHMKRIAPSASTRVTHPALIAPNGGSLIVKQSTSSETNSNEPNSNADEFKLYRPRFHAVATLDRETSKMLFVGETGVVRFDPHPLTLGQWVTLTLRDWIEQKIKQATQSTS